MSSAAKRSKGKGKGTGPSSGGDRVHSDQVKTSTDMNFISLLGQTAVLFWIIFWVSFYCGGMYLNQKAVLLNSLFKKITLYTEVRQVP